MTGGVADLGTNRSAGYVLLTCGYRIPKSLRVSFAEPHVTVAPSRPTHLVLLIDRRELPQGVWESHSVVISRDV